MKKTISALAVAAALGTAASAQGAEFRAGEDTTFSVYGNLQYAYVNEERATATGVESQSELLDNGSTIGIEGEHEWDNGLTGFFRAEWEFLGDEKVIQEPGREEGIDQTDEVFAGVKGGFGKVQVGTWDGLFQDYISDPLNPFEYTGTTEFNGTGEPGNSIAYWTPSLGGFTFAIQGFFEGDGEGRDFDGDGEPDSEQAFQAVAAYEAGIFGVALGYDDRGFEEGADGNIGLTGTVDLAPFSLAAKVQQVGDTDTVDGGMMYGLLGSFDYGPGSLTAAVQQVDVDSDLNGDDARTEMLFNANYAIAENLYVYGEVGMLDVETDEGDYTAVGAVYSF